MPSSRGSSQCRDQTQVSRIACRFFTNRAIREVQEDWSGQPFPSPGGLPNPGIEPGSPALQADSLPAVQAIVHLSMIAHNFKKYFFFQFY